MSNQDLTEAFIKLQKAGELEIEALQKRIEALRYMMEMCHPEIPITHIAKTFASNDDIKVFIVETLINKDIQMPKICFWRITIGNKNFEDSSIVKAAAKTNLNKEKLLQLFILVDPNTEKDFEKIYSEIEKLRQIIIGEQN